MWCRRRVERGIDVKSRGDVNKLCATKTDDDTSYRFVISRTSGAQYICPLSSRAAQRTNAGPAQAVTLPIHSQDGMEI